MLSHLEIYVSNLSRSSEFWGWFLTEIGYEPFQKWESGFRWKHGETYIVFVQADDRFLDIPHHRSRVGLNHLAFQAVSREQVNQMTLQLKEKGVNILYPDKHPFAGGGSHYAVFFEDPDLIKVEVVAPK